MQSILCYYLSIVLLFLQTSVARTNCHLSEPMSRDNKLVTNAHKRQSDFDSSLCH